MSTIFRQQSSRANGAKSRGPITEDGKLASAANSALSTGPRTPEGKAVVARNALDHGLLAKSVILPEENDDAFLQHLEGLRGVYHPTDYEEQCLLQQIALADWRRLRTLCVEMAVIARASREEQMNSDDLTHEMHQEIPAMYTSIGMKNLADSGNYLELLRRYAVAHSGDARRLRRQFREHRESKRLEQRRVERRRKRISEHSEPNIGKTLGQNESQIETPINPTDTQHQPESR